MRVSTAQQRTTRMKHERDMILANAKVSAHSHSRDFTAVCSFLILMRRCLGIKFKHWQCWNVRCYSMSLYVLKCMNMLYVSRSVIFAFHFVVSLIPAIHFSIVITLFLLCCLLLGSASRNGGGGGGDEDDDVCLSAVVRKPTYILSFFLVFSVSSLGKTRLMRILRKYFCSVHFIHFVWILKAYYTFLFAERIFAQNFPLHCCSWKCSLSIYYSDWFFFFASTGMR